MKPSECEKILEAMGFEVVSCSQRVDKYQYPTALFVRRREDGEFDQVTLTFYPPMSGILGYRDRQGEQRKKMEDHAWAQNEKAMGTIDGALDFAAVMELCG